MTSICFVLCYLGPLPRYFGTFLATCEQNTDVNFLIVSDQPSPPQLGSNIRWVSATLESLRSRFSDSLGFLVALEGGYKLCDYKPIFGEVFADELEGYEFWGFTDPDLVWGHIRSFATEERLVHHDILTFRGRSYISGPCTLLRSTSRLKGLFREAPGYEKVFQDPEYKGFDETFGRWREQPSLVDLAESNRPVSFSDVVRYAAAQEELRWLDEDEIVERSPAACRFTFRWEHGHLYQESERGVPLHGAEGQEVLLYHYVNAKKRPFFYIPECRTLPDLFFITEQGAFFPQYGGWLRRANYGRKRLWEGVPPHMRALWKQNCARWHRLINASASPKPAS